MQTGRWTIEKLRALPREKAPCPKCNKKTDEKVLSANIHFIGTAVTCAEFNPGLGQVVKNKRHKEDILKRKGLVEVGNDFNSGDKQQKHYEQKQKEEKERRWADPSSFFL